MFIYREVKHTDIEALSQFFLQNNENLSTHMAYLHSSMLLEINGTICGFAGFRLLTDVTAKLAFVIIDVHRRRQQFGDGLVKALLNTAELRGILVIFSQEHQFENGESFMEAIGFLPINAGERIAYPELSTNSELTHIAHLPEYFKTACKAKRVKNEAQKG